MDKCQCAPWFLELQLGKEVKLCETYGNYCFKDVVENRLKLPQCGSKCLPDCQRVSYKVEEAEKKRCADNAHGALVIFNAIMFCSFLREDPKTLIFYDYLTKNKTQDTHPAVLKAVKPIS